MKHLIHLAFALLRSTSRSPPPPRPKPSPSPGPDVQKIYDRLLDANRKNSHLRQSLPRHAFPTIPTWTPWPALPTKAPSFACATTIRNSSAAAKSLFGYPYNDFQPEHAKWLIDKKKAAESERRHRLLGRHSGQAEHRNLSGQPRSPRSVSRPQALPLGFLRRFVSVSLRQPRSDRQERRHGRLHSAAGESSLSAT